MTTPPDPPPPGVPAGQPGAGDSLNLTERLAQHLGHLSRDRNPDFAPAGHLYAQIYLRQELATLGTVRSLPFHHRGRRYTNWSLSLPGRYPQRPPVVVGAHFDTVPGSPGADDNASGVAALLEIARALAQNLPHSPVEIVAFDLEEYGFVGSTAYADAWAAQGRPLRLMVSLEMLGYYTTTPGCQTYPPGVPGIYPTKGDFIALIGNHSSVPAMVKLWAGCRRAGARCQWLPVADGGRTLPDTRRSDHVPFWDRGYRAVMVTDTADLRNPHYHQPTDTVDTLNVPRLAQVCAGLTVGLRWL